MWGAVKRLAIGLAIAAIGTVSADGPALADGHKKKKDKYGQDTQWKGDNTKAWYDRFWPIGDRVKVKNLKDEYVEFRNNDNRAIQLQGWTLRDEANHTFAFPSHVMQPGQVCRVYTNEYHPE